MAKKGKKGHQAAAARAAKAKAEESTAPAGDARKGVKGLKNLGNTCYVNSVIQCMHAATEFRESLPTGTNGNSMCSSLGSVLKSMSGPGAAVGPKALHTTFCNKFPWFKGHQQHDAHEFFCTLVGAVADEKPKNGNNNKEAKDDSGEEGQHGQTPSGEAAAQNFQGQICSTFLCWKCKRISMRVCPYFHLSVPVPECDSECGLLGLPVELQQVPWAPEQPEHTTQTPQEDPQESPEPEPVAEPMRDSGAVRQFCEAEVQTDDEVSEPAAPGAAAVSEAARPEEAQATPQPVTEMEAGAKDMPPPETTLNGTNGTTGTKEAEHATRAENGKDQGAAQNHPPNEDDCNGTAPVPPTNGDAPTNGDTPLNGDAPTKGPEENKEKNGETTWLPAAELPEATPEHGSDEGNHEKQEPEPADAPQDKTPQDDTPYEENSGHQADTEEQEDQPEEEEGPFNYEVLLRSEKTGKQDYGFKWNMSALSKDQLIVASIVPDSIVDKWNLKKLTMGEANKVVRPGDQIMEVQGEKEHKQMLKLLKQEPELTLGIQRTDLHAPVDIPHELPNNDKEDKEDEEDRVERKNALLEAWRGCQEGLPDELQSMYSGKSLGINGGSCSLMDCLQKFAGVEAMEEDFHPSYDCSDCAKAAEGEAPENGNAKKKHKMYATSKSWLCGSMPKLLTVQLKRFNRKLQKIKTKVAVPATLDLSDLMMTPDIAKNVREHLKSECEKQELPISPDEKASYELFGIVQHHGSTLQGGHYTAYVNLGRSLEEGNWYFCNDATVAKCSIDDALKAETYVAFYRKIEDGD